MKLTRLFPVLLMAFFMATSYASAQTDTQTGTQPTGSFGAKLTFVDNEYAFGTVQQGDIVEHTFSFTNTGSEDLMIMSAKASCGCTVPTWPRDAIAPGESGEIKVRFNTAGKLGVQRKSVTIRSNAEGQNVIILLLSGEVIKAAG